MFYVVDPGDRGVRVTLGSVDATVVNEGFGMKLPFITDINRLTIKQQVGELKAACFSSDLQQVNMLLKVMYRMPESSTLEIFRGYAGSPFDTLIGPRVYEAMKEVTAAESAESIVRHREQIKVRAKELASKKVGTILVIEDIVIENIDLSNELETAIEQKMVQEQEAAKAKFTQQKTEIEARTNVIRAEGEAKALSIQGEAIRKNPETMQMELIKKWNGVSPMVVGSGSGTNVIMPLHNK
jgi:prohibitin 2